MITFHTLKWGNKYGPEYVNRLYGSLKKQVDVPFKLNCISDDHNGLDDKIYRTPLSEIRDVYFTEYPLDRVFTREKLCLFKMYKRGRHAWLDLDILIHKNITEEVTMDIQQPKFIWNYWNDYERRSLRWYGKGGSCHVNSSFVMWQDDQGLKFYEHLVKTQKQSFFTYKSLDKYLFYQHHRKSNMDFWDEGFVSSYNKDGFSQNRSKISIFNTSHMYNNKGIKEIAYELDEAEGWAKDLWTSYY